MKTLVALTGLLLLIAVAAAPPCALADDPAPPAKSGPADASATQSRAPAGIPDLPENQAEIEAGLVPDGKAVEAQKSDAAPALTPLMAEIQAVLADEQTRVAELEARLSSSLDEGAALALRRQIEQIKVETELNILRLQAEHARRAGQDEQAAAIEAAIAEMLSPRPAGVPSERPAPIQNGSQR